MPRMNKIEVVNFDSKLAIIDNVFDYMSSFLFLYESYRNARKNKRYRPDVLVFTDDLEHNLLQLNKELLDETYDVGPYHIFYVYEPKLRMVMSIQFRDRVVQWSIYSILYPFYDKLFIEDSYACRRNKGLRKAVDRLQNWLVKLERSSYTYYYLKLDISKYFYKVNHDILLNILKRRIKDEKLLRLLNKIINNKNTNFGLPDGILLDDCTLDDMISETGMPIGNLTSQLFANIYLNELDQYCKHVLHIKYYIRYMDDIIILDKDRNNLLRIRKLIEDFLRNELCLSLNDKTCINKISSGITFVGLKIWSTYKKIRKSTIKRIKRNIKILSLCYKNNFIDKSKFRDTIYSYKNILDFCSCHGFSNCLIDLFNITVKGVHMKTDNIKFSESVSIIKLNKKEDSSMNFDEMRWSCKTRIEKYHNDEDYKNNKPYDIIDIKGNTALINGLKLLWNLAIGNGDDTNKYFFSSSNACIGVGNSSASANSAQTGLLGSSRYYKPMDQSTGIIYPYITNNTVTFRAKFGSTEGNFTWNEWGVINGNPMSPGQRDESTMVQLNRKVESMGTKVAGSTWVIVVDLTINPS